MTKEEVVAVLRRTPKGKLKYDYDWDQEGRTQVILDEVSSNSCLNVSLEALDFVKLNESFNSDKDYITDTEDASVCRSSREKSVINISEREKKTDPYILTPLSEIELSLLEYEENDKRAILKLFEERRTDMEIRTKLLEINLEQEEQLLRRNSELKAMQKNAELDQLLDQHFKIFKEKELEKERHTTQQAKRKSAIMKEVEEKQRLAEEQQQRRQKEQEEWRQQLIACHMELFRCTAHTKEILDSCSHKEHLDAPGEECYNQMNNILSAIREVVVVSQTKDVEIEDLSKAQQLFDDAQMIYKSICEDIEQAEKKGLIEAEEQRKSQPSSRDRSRQVSGNSTKHMEDGLIATDPSLDKISSSRGKNGGVQDETDLPIYTCISPDGLKMYSSVIQSLTEWEKTCNPFTSDSKNKAYILSIRKAITTPINVISSQSGSNLREKLDRLLMFLKGQSVEVTGRRISCKDHPLALTFSKGVIAQQFVCQGEGQISSNFSSAFPFAAAMVGLWTHYPDVGRLIVAFFCKKCPYLVPYYPPREENQSDMDYYKSLGYRYDGNTIEKQDKFLKRMSGFMRLYAAAIQSPQPPGCKGSHPHSVEWGWRWLAQVLNLEPRPDITATLIFDFLEVAGHVLQKTYGNQFQKMLHALCKDYFPKIEAVTPPTSAAPLSRLKDFLHNAIKQRLIRPPEGILSSSFFFS